MITENDEHRTCPQIVCILASIRSGSTLLNQLLGAHSKIAAVGELHWLRAYALDDRRLYNPPHELLCACGRAFADCEFWTAISRIVAMPLSDLQMMPRFFRWRGPGATPQAKYERIFLRVVESWPTVYRSELVQKLYYGQRIAIDNMKVFSAIFRHTNSPWIVDSSKNPFRFRSLYDWYPRRLRAIALQRDYRAVIYSQMKRGVTLEDSARGWVRKTNQIDALTKDIPEQSIVRLRYEDLCARPVEELQRVCQWLGLEFEERMLSRPTADIHDIGGSPSKFQKGRREIHLDTGYLRDLSEAQLSRMRRLVGSAAEKYGYV